MTISIIIPVYNSEAFLPTCLDSILSQSFTSFEVLLVDDGSKDKSGSICDEYAIKDSRVRVFHKENGGVSSARNLALEKAEGEWICFVDSDDELLPDGLSELAAGISDSVDFIMLGFVKSIHYEKGDPLPRGEGKVVSREEAMLHMFNDMFRVYQGYSFAKLFRRELIVNHHLSFDPSITIKEDNLFVVSYLCHSGGKAYISSTPVYFYFQRPMSAMESLKETYSPKFLTSFDATVLINRNVEKAFPYNRKLLSCSHFEVMNRVYLVLSHMIMHNAVDKRIISHLRKRAYHEVGVIPYLNYEFHRNKRRLTRIVNKVFKTDFHV